MANRQPADLEYIRRIVSQGRRAIVLDARPFVIWGLLVVAAFVADLSLQATQGGALSIWIWLALMTSGWGLALWIWIRRRRRVGATTLADRALGRLWFACWGSMFLIGFGGFFTEAISGAAISGALAAILGIGFQVTSVLVSSPLLSRLGVGWWAVALAIFLLPGLPGSVLFAAAMLSMQVLPAVLLQRRWRQGGGRDEDL